MEDNGQQIDTRLKTTDDRLKPRQGWAKAFQEMAERGDDRLLDHPVPTAWDEEEWDW